MKILEVLSSEKYISGNEIGSILNISRSAVHKQIKKLRNSGFIIDSSSKGYKLIKNIPEFSVEKVYENFSAPVSICKKILCFKRIVSTQTKLKSLAGKGGQEGTVIVAREQDGAYGRMRRSWSSNAGGLWFSMLLKPPILPGHASKISLLAGLAVNRVLKNKYEAESKIKWPNDILCKGKKIAGVIIEMSAEQDRINWIAAGVGINVDNVLPDNLPDAAALSAITDKSIDRAELLSFFLTEFDGIYNEFKSSGFAGFAGEYNKNAAFIYENVIIDNGFDIIKGTNKGINEDGNLIIETDKGFEAVISGTLRRSQ